MHVALTDVETERLGSVLSLLLAPSASQSVEAWRREVARALRALVSADKAVLVLEATDGTHMYGDHLERAVMHAYESYCRALDLGIVRRQEPGIELWSREMLRGNAALVRSDHYNDFARALYDVVGLAVTLGPPRVHVRVVLFHYEPAHGPAATARQLSLLTLVLPAFKAGVAAHLHRMQTGSAAKLDQLTPLLDAVEEPLALYDPAGRILHQNAAMARTLGADGVRGELRQALDQLARATVAAAPTGCARSVGARGPVTRDVRTPAARYHLRGSLVELDAASAACAEGVLLSLQRCAPEPPNTDELRARFGLTRREVEIAKLLLQRRSNAEIARALAISPHTARHHTERVLHKLGVRSRAALGDALSAS